MNDSSRDEQGWDEQQGVGFAGNAAAAAARSERDDTAPAASPTSAPGVDAPARVHLVVGPVGAGKSTVAGQLARSRGAVRFTLDAWMTALFSPDRPERDVVPWYVERAARCVDLIWAQAREVARTGTEVILELGLLDRRARRAFCERVEAAGHPLSVIVVDAPREIRRERVERRNEERGPTFSMVVPAAVFELASDLWEPPDEDERTRFEVADHLAGARP